MFAYTETAIRDISYLEKLPSTWDIQGLYELNWRMERCLLPIHEAIIDVYTHILDKYESCLLPTNSDIGLKRIWIELKFAVYRWCRENDQAPKRVAIEERLLDIAKDDTEFTNRIRFERVLWSLTSPDIGLLDEALEQWGRESRPPLWNCRYAALLCETGRIDDAIRIYETTLAEIRPNIPKGKIKDDFHLLCIEGFILIALHLARSACGQFPCAPDNDDTVSNNIPLSRLEQLSAMKCNPYDSMWRHKTLMSAPIKREIGKFSTRNFDSTKLTWRSKSGWLDEPRYACQCARFIEESPIPLHVGCVVNELTHAAPGCIIRLSHYLPTWAFGLYLRVGQTNEVSEECFLSEIQISQLTNEQINSLIDRYSSQIQYLVECKSELLDKRPTSIYHRMAAVMFELLSRLSAKAPQSALTSLINLVHFIEKSSIKTYDFIFKRIGDFYRRVITAFEPETLFYNLELLLTVSFPPERPYNRFWDCPMSFVHFRGYHKSNLDCTKKAQDLIQQYVAMFDSPDPLQRSAALSALQACLNLGVCTDNQLIQIAHKICAIIGNDFQSPVPIAYIFAMNSLLKYPITHDIIAQTLTSLYLNFDFDVNSKQITTDSSCYNLPVSCFAESLLSSSSAFITSPPCLIDLTYDDSKSILTNFMNGLIKSLPKLRLTTTPSSFVSVFKPSTYNELFPYDMILGEVLIPRLSSQDRFDIAEWLSHLGFDFPFLCSRVALSIYSGCNLTDQEYGIITAITCADYCVSKDGFRALLNWCKMANLEKGTLPPDAVFQHIVSIIAVDNDQLFHSACYYLSKLFPLIPLSPMIEKQLLYHIGLLANITKFDNSTMRFDNTSRADFRADAAYLAYHMYRTYIDRKIPIPDEILTWKEICASQDELRSVRRCWDYSLYLDESSDSELCFDSQDNT